MVQGIVEQVRTENAHFHIKTKLLTGSPKPSNSTEE